MIRDNKLDSENKYITRIDMLQVYLRVENNKVYIPVRDKKIKKV